MRLTDLAETSAAVAATSSRAAKAERIAACLRRAGPGEAELAVRYLSGAVRQRRAGVGWAAIATLPPPAPAPGLTLTDVDRALERAESRRGAGAAAARRAEVLALFGRATLLEQRFLAALVLGELRQGAQAGVMADAVARAAGLDPRAVRRATMLGGDLAVVAARALRDGAGGLEAFRLTVGRPVQPMLARSAPTVVAALARLGAATVEWKLDGVRVQIHREGDAVAVFTRTLDPVTDRVPELVAAVRALPLRSVVLDGEAVALRPDGRPRPFQETAARTARRRDVERRRREVPLTLFCFDCLHLDGQDWFDHPLRERRAAAAAVVPPALWVPSRSGDGAEAASAFLDDAVARGHEGVVVKELDSLYEAGRRGAGWVKVKPHLTLDLVVLAAERGHGRRQGRLSNLHLGARDPDGGAFLMLGKTFKGLTDAMLEWQTEHLRPLAVREEGGTVWVRPELVVEVAFDGVQTSPRYPAGLALRFARVVRHRPDKGAADADTVDMVRRIHGWQGGGGAD